MLLKKNLLETVTVFSCSGVLFLLLFNLVTNISPLKGVWFTIYSFIVFCVSVSLSFRFIQWLLHLNKPLHYDFEQLINKYPYLSVLKEYIPQPRAVTWECKEYDTNELSIITTVLERKLVSSWYVPFVSQEIGFPFACKQLLDQIVGKGFQISNKIEAKEVYVDTCIILTMHLKEYKKALKRQEKSPGSSIECLYKKSHLISEKGDQNSLAEHCTNILRVVLKELVPWELWDTPHSELLIRILAKRLDSFIDSTLADPKWLNNKLLTFFKGCEPVKNDVNPTSNSTENLKDIPNESQKETEVTNITDNKVIEKDVKPIPTPTIEEAISTIINNTAPIINIPVLPVNGDSKINNKLNRTSETSEELGEEVSELVEEVKRVNGSEPVQIQSSPILRQRRGRQGRNEVKIYDRVIEGSVKTWETDVDLQCISMGQDLLAGLSNSQITLSRLWDADEAAKDESLWFGEDDIDLDLDSKEMSPIKKEANYSSKTEIRPKRNSPKSNCNAKPESIPKPETSPKPEHSPKPTSPKPEHSPKPTSPKPEYSPKPTSPKPEYSPKPTSPKQTSPKPETSPKPAEILLKDLQTTVHQAKTKIGDLQVLQPDLDVDNDEAAGMMEGLLDFGIAGLKKGLRFTGLSDDSMDKSPKEMNAEKHSPPTTEKHKLDNTVPRDDTNGVAIVPPLVKQHRVVSQDSLLVGGRGLDSPEPEYEEASDLSTSIAKLRCLLEMRGGQHSNSTNGSGADVWWDSAEETLGRTQQHHSSRPVDAATLADEYDPSNEKTSSPNQAANNMQRLDKFLNRAVTGVFNSIMSAVGADDGGAAVRHQWTYVTTDTDHSVGNAVARLVGSRRAYNHVDTALDSLEQLPQSVDTTLVVPEDFEEWCVTSCRVWCALTELASTAGFIHSHQAYRAQVHLAADMSESLITSYLADMTSHLRKQVFVQFERMNEDIPEQHETIREFNIDETCEAILDALPAFLQIFGSDVLSSAINLVVSSLSHKELNKDLLARILDVLALHFKNAAGVKGYDHN